MVFLSSCFKEPKQEPVGEAKIRFVNAVPGTPQDVYYNGNKMAIPPVAYGNVTAYQTIESGPGFFGYTDQGTTVANFQGSVGVNIGDNLTSFYFKTLIGNPSVGFVYDDMTAPPAGKARVRFIQLNQYLNNSISVGVQGGAPLVLVVPFGQSSAYFNVDPGIKLEVKATGVDETIFDPNIVAGKIYTIWFDGTTATEMNGHVIVQN